MPGGLQGRLLREQVKAQKLSNAQAAQSLNDPNDLLQTMQGMENIFSAQQNRQQQANRQPAELIQAMLQNEQSRQQNQAGALRLDNLPQSLQQELAQNQLNLTKGQLGNDQLTGQIEGQAAVRGNYEEDRQRAFEAQQLARIVALIQSASYNSDTSQATQDALGQEGFNTTITPKADPRMLEKLRLAQELENLTQGEQQSGPSPEEARAMLQQFNTQQN